MRDSLIEKDITIKRALEAMEAGGRKGLVVVDSADKLLGTLSDGDVRKAILSSVDLNCTIEDCFNKSPIYFIKGEYKELELRRSFIESKIHFVPILDQTGRVIDVVYWDTVFGSDHKKSNQELDAQVVIMAGGEGTRLEPFTKILPKPLVPIHDKPVIEHIIQGFTQSGIKEFFLTVNYKSRILKAYFEELAPDYSVEFIEEENPLGTAGGLRKLEGRITRPFLVTNCDIIVRTDYVDLYNFHIERCADLTVVASTKNYLIPYGTCKLDDSGYLTEIVEKPEYQFLVNTGLYVVNPEILSLIPSETKMDMTDLIKGIKETNGNIGVYPVGDKTWTDVGQWAEYRKVVDSLK